MTTLLGIQQQITLLKRQRLELHMRIRVHCPDAASLRQLEVVESSIYGLTQRFEDELYAGRLREQGAAAVEKVERILER